MLNSSQDKSFSDALDSARHKERVRFWMVSSFWVLGAFVLGLYLWRGSTDLEIMRSELENLHRSADELKKQGELATKQAQDANGLASEVNRTLNETKKDLTKATTRIAVLGSNQEDQSRKALQLTTTLSSLQLELASKEEQRRELDSRLNQTQSTLATSEVRFAQLNGDIEKAQEQTAKALKQEQEIVERLKALAEEAESKFQNIERQLQTAHYVFKTRSKNRVWGMDVFIRFGPWNKSKSGLNDLCVSTTRDGVCKYGPEFLPLGKTINVGIGEYRYTITARYVVEVPLLHDQVGFDVYQEPNKN